MKTRLAVQLRQHLGVRAHHQHSPDLLCRRQQAVLQREWRRPLPALRMRSVTDSRMFTRVTANAAATSS